MKGQFYFYLIKTSWSLVYY